MWYLELIVSLAILASVAGSIYFKDMASDTLAVNYEAIRLVNCLKEVQQRSRSSHSLGNNAYLPSCHIYKDKYQLNVGDGSTGEFYYLTNGVRIESYTATSFYAFKQRSLFNGVDNKTLKIYKNKAVKYIIINRVGRIRIAIVYAQEP